MTESPPPDLYLKLSQDGRCLNCDFCAPNNKALAFHVFTRHLLRNAHDLWQFRCSFCSLSFQDLEQLSSHFRSAHFKLYTVPAPAPFNPSADSGEESNLMTVPPSSPPGTSPRRKSATLSVSMQISSAAGNTIPAASSSSTSSETMSATKTETLTASDNSATFFQRLTTSRALDLSVTNSTPAEDGINTGDQFEENAAELSNDPSADHVVASTDARTEQTDQTEDEEPGQQVPTMAVPSDEADPTDQMVVVSPPSMGQMVTVLTYDPSLDDEEHKGQQLQMMETVVVPAESLDASSELQIVVMPVDDHTSTYTTTLEATSVQTDQADPDQSSPVVMPVSTSPHPEILEEAPGPIPSTSASAAAVTSCEAATPSRASTNGKLEISEEPSASKVSLPTSPSVLSSPASIPVASVAPLFF